MFKFQCIQMFHVTVCILRKDLFASCIWTWYTRFNVRMHSQGDLIHSIAWWIGLLSQNISILFHTSASYIDYPTEFSSEAKIALSVCQVPSVSNAIQQTIWETCNIKCFRLRSFLFHLCFSPTNYVFKSYLSGSEHVHSMNFNQIWLFCTQF